MSETPSNFTVEPEFTNKTLSVTEINTATMAMTPISPKYRQINLIWGACFGAVLAIILTLFTSGIIFDLPENARPYVIGGYVFIAINTLRNLIYHVFADPLIQYALREHDLNYQSGLIFRSLVSQPILRIQHIEIRRGPIERQAGLATLQVFSAGGVSHTFNIPGLVYKDAVSLRQFILDHKDLAADV